jgi:hypothetical protein
MLLQLSVIHPIEWVRAPRLILQGEERVAVTQVI